MLVLKSVTKAFGGLTAVNDCSFELEDGIAGLIGPNGAGKTTMFNLISGFSKPNSGQIFFQGKEITGMPPHKIAQTGIVRTFQLIRILRQQTVLENVMLGFRNIKSEEFWQGLFMLPSVTAQDSKIRNKAKELVALVGLENKEGELAENLSYGEQKMLEIARALASEPKLLLLDEPVAGVLPSTASEILHLISQLKKSGTTILVTEHRLKEITPICDRFIVMDAGKKIADGKPNEVLKMEHVIEAYYGGRTAPTS